MPKSRAFRFIVVGAGSAGCALAARLSEDAATEVLLLEAGGKDWSPLLHIPLAVGKLLRDGLYGWGYRTEPEEALLGRSLIWPRGKVLGGSSAINGMVYIRGAPSDYDEWAALGNPGWSYPEVLPYFKRAEGHRGRHDAYHGTDGPVSVTCGSSPNPLYEAFIQAGEEAGFGRTTDFNGTLQEGFGRYDFTIANGRRSGTAVSYLRPALSRRNLRLELHSQVIGLEFKGARAVGLQYLRHGRVERAYADEVVLAAGSINTPQILMLAGIGDPEALEKAGVRPRHALPGVGENLQEHVQVAVGFDCNEPITLHSLIRADRMALAMLRAFFLRSGPATSFPVEAGAFTRSDDAQALPDLQFYMMIGLGADRLRFPTMVKNSDPLKQEGYAIRALLLQPASAGQLVLRSADPLTKIAIRPNWFAHPEDLETLMRGIAQARLLATQPSLARYGSREIFPGTRIRSKADLERWVRASAAPGHHQVGTCRMGNDPLAVVDARLRVRGIEGLSIADTSVIPKLPRGNTNAAAIMIGEKAADLLLMRPSLPAEDPRSRHGRNTSNVPQVKI